MNNDLISREALKKRIEAWEYYGVFDKSYLIDIIDNAPTVTDRTEEVLSLQNTIAKLVEGIAENARPKGEWKVFYTPKKKKVFKCDKCLAVSIQGQTNFCPNCGAKMKGGES